ncbi:hypothetical protein ACFVYC_08930 [Pseudarthrobacter sp. NPDC058329]|uniref:hypothetical protein n=1 Tax=Pseudarthrobacter sp. NPDC058329 TaxID=3346448 RepID=UPI0036D79167
MNVTDNGSPAQGPGRAVVLTTDDLMPGDTIEAFYRGTLVHRGPVTDIAPNHGLFWILDQLTGGRRLLDIVEFQIVRGGTPDTSPDVLVPVAAGQVMPGAA